MATRSSPIVTALGRTRICLREPLAEFLGTFVFLTLGYGTNAKAVLGHANGNAAIDVHLGWGIALAAGIWLAGGVSGGHLNPMVSMTLAAHTDFPWRKVPRYVLAQFLGAMCAAAAIFATHSRALTALDGGTRTVPDHALSPEAQRIATGGIFASFPQEYESAWSAFLAELVTAAMFMIPVLAVTDARNPIAPRSHWPVACGLLLVVLGTGLGLPTGYAVNPACDLGGRVVAAALGYGPAMFTAFNGYFWVPPVASTLGGILGGYIYNALMVFDHEDTEILPSKPSSASTP
ncbi:aquaporin-9 [Blastocladiella britannica]|nr:aquaporin-9 [Blastocladiella britannica]